MGSPGRIDREKYEADILERVIKGIQSEEVDYRTPSHVAEPAGVRPWLGGHVLSAVHVQIVDSLDDSED